MMTHTRVAALVLLLLPAAALAQAPVAPPASPQVTEARGKVRVACAVDVQKFCPNIERGKGERRACLQAHQADLSDGCRAARVQREAAGSKGKD
jgi:hypothetical protein